MIPAAEQLGLGRAGAATSTAGGRPSCGRCRARRSARAAERVDDRPAGVAAARDLEREHPAGDARPELARGDGVLGMAGETRVEDAAHAVLTLEPARRVPRRSAAWRSTRTARVRMPRRTRNASNGPRVAPVSIWTRSTAAIEARRAGDDAGDQVAVAAEELRRRLDDEVGARARAAGRRTGEANVLSTTYVAPWRWARSASAAWSATNGRRVGDRLRVEDPGRARPRAAASTASRSVMSTKSTVDAEAAERVEQQRPRRPVRPPRGATTRSPAASSDASAAWIAPIPDARATPASPPASSA